MYLTICWAQECAISVLSMILALFVILSLGSGTLYAQSNFQQGLIITQSGDSLRGQIDDLEWIKSPDYIRFRKKADSEIQTFTPLNLSAFQVAGRWYKGAIIPVDQATLKARLLLPAITPS